MLNDAVSMMAERHISELPVVDADGRPAGLLDITDVVALYPDSTPAALPAQSSNPADLPRSKNAA